MGGPLVSNIYAQSPDELRQEFEKKLNELRQEFERKLQEAVERVYEAAGCIEFEETNSPSKQTPEAQAPQVLLAPAPIPPAASTPALGWFFNVDFQAINFWGIEGPFAARKPVGLNAAIPTGRWRTVDVDRDFSARPTLGYYLPNGGGILSANFFHVNTTGRASFSDPVSFLVGPGNQGPFELNNVISASSRNNVEMNQFDLQYQYPVQVTRNFTLTPELGVRGVFFNNSIATKYATDTSAVFTTSFMSKSGAGAARGVRRTAPGPLRGSPGRQGDGRYSARSPALLGRRPGAGIQERRRLQCVPGGLGVRQGLDPLCWGHWRLPSWEKQSEAGV